MALILLLLNTLLITDRAAAATPTKRISCVGDSIIREVAAELGLPVVDIHAATEGKPELFPEKLHPSEQGAKIIAETVHEQLMGKRNR